MEVRIYRGRTDTTMRHVGTVNNDKVNNLRDAKQYVRTINQLYGGNKDVYDVMIEHNGKPTVVSDDGVRFSDSLFTARLQHFGLGRNLGERMTNQGFRSSMSSTLKRMGNSNT